VPARPTFDYAILRAVPRVERGECVNVGIVLFSREHGFLGLAVDVDESRLRALDPAVDIETIRRHLEALEAIARGDAAAGPLARLTPAERFYWLSAPRSTVIQVSPAHVGWCDDPERALRELMDALVRPPR
jgi:hypothetical protein